MQRKPIYALGLVICALIAYMFIAAYQEAKKTAIDELNARQFSQARQAKMGIEQYIHHYDVILEFLSRNPDIAAINASGKELMRLILNQGRGDIRSVTRVNRYGKISHVEPYLSSAIGRDIRHQKHIREILTTHKPAISDIFRTVQGYDAIVIHYPVFKERLFDGSIAIVFSIEGLADKFIKDIKIGRDGYAWMISREGIELSCPVPGHIGKPVSETSATSPSVLAMAARMQRGEEGTTTYNYDFIRGEERLNITKHAVFMPIKVGNTIWSIAVATPESEVLAIMRSFTYRMILIAILLAGGIALASYLIFRSWSEAKKIEMRRKSDEKFHKTFENAPVGVIISSLPDGNFVEVNDAYLAQIGYERSELIGRTGNELNLWVYPSERDWLIENLRRGGSTKNMEVSQRARDGHIRIMLVSADVLRVDDRDYLLAVYHDITEKRALELEAIKAHKLESIGILAGGIAHDFNNLLTGILANISLLKMTGERNTADLQKLEAAEMASLRARDLTQQLLTFSKGGAPVMSVVEICQLVKESATFSLHGAAVRLTFECAEGIKCVIGDTGQLSQVINNIVINAVQAIASKSDGEIRITIKNQPVTGGDSSIPLASGEYVSIAIADNGVGIGKETLANIFDPYFTTKEKGSGLGLAVVYSIIRNHGGHIVASSSQGAGTTFTIYLPATNARPDQQAGTDTTYSGGTGRLLIVDDEEFVRFASSEILQAFGYEVSLAHNGHDAIKLYSDSVSRHKRFDAVIMDLTMPGGMSGLDTSKKILEIDPDAVIIVSSGYSTDPVMADYRRYGFAASVVKPYRADTLLSAIKDCLKGSENKSG